MIVSISKRQADRIGFYTNPDFVRACFYLGIGMEEMRECIRDVYASELMGSIVESAISMGMTDSDVVIVRSSNEGNKSVLRERTIGSVDSLPERWRNARDRRRFKGHAEEGPAEPADTNDETPG